MSVNWEKRYSFRLQEEDEKIYNLLSQVPDNRRSDTIRQMLRFAYRTMSGEQKVNEGNQLLLAEVKLLKENLEKRHQELLGRIDSSLAMREGEVSSTDSESTITEQAIDDSASAMLSSFGVEF